MKEIFYEESSLVANPKNEKIKYKIFSIISIISYVLFVIFVIFLIISIFNFDLSVFKNKILYILLNIIIILLLLVLLFLSGFIFGKIKNKFYNEFDYTFVSGSIRFSKVIMNKKRKPIISFESNCIEKIGYLGSTEYQNYIDNNIVIDVLTSNLSVAKEVNLFYIVVNVDGEKKMFILECTEKLIANILQFTSPLVWDKTSNLEKTGK